MLLVEYLYEKVKNKLFSMRWCYFCYINEYDWFGLFIFGEMWYEVDIDVDLYRLVKYNCRFEI